MNKIAKISVISLVIAAAGATAVNASWNENRGKCDRDGMRGKSGMMMNQKSKQGQFAVKDLNLTAEKAKTLVQARLIMRGNDRLKVGQVTEKDKDTYLVDIVTVDDSLVRQIEVDRDQGLPRGRFPKK